MAREVQQDRRGEDGRWESISRLVLPVSREDNRGEVECIVNHPALEEEVTRGVTLNIFFPPIVEAYSNIPKTKTSIAEGDSVTLTCEADSNPPSSLSWRKMGRDTEFLGSTTNLPLGPVSRATAGTYQCTAENELGLSQP